VQPAPRARARPHVARGGGAISAVSQRDKCVGASSSFFCVERRSTEPAPPHGARGAVASSRKRCEHGVTRARHNLVATDPTARTDSPLFVVHVPRPTPALSRESGSPHSGVPGRTDGETRTPRGSRAVRNVHPDLWPLGTPPPQTLIHPDASRIGGSSPPITHTAASPPVQ
jgi:hypothetical protein